MTEQNERNKSLPIVDKQTEKDSTLSTGMAKLSRGVTTKKDIQATRLQDNQESPKKHTKTNKYKPVANGLIWFN